MGSKTINQNMDFSTFRQRLRDLIRERGITSARLADDTNITKAAISRYITTNPSMNRDPDLQYVYRLAQYFDVSLDWLLGLNNDRNNIYSDDALHFADLYNHASNDDKAVIQAVLRKYDHT